MKRQHLAHAERVVSSFKRNLNEGEIAGLGQQHFDELTLLIESAISSSVLDELEATANKLHEFANDLEKHAEHV
ncbi:MAG: phosphatase [Gammaproteobacteria bacterium]|nr:MAG: phosphatase [Gammaproteobacteria bacterium]